MPEVNMNRFADLVKETVRLRDVEGVGLPDFMEVPATVAGLMDIWAEMVSLWHNVSRRDPKTQVLGIVPIADLVGKALGPRADAIAEAWYALNAVVRRTEDMVIDEEVLIDQLIAVGRSTARHTNDLWTGAEPSKMRDRGLQVSEQLRSRLAEAQDEEEIRRIRARAQAAAIDVEGAARKAQEALKTQQEAVGETGSLSLASHFSDLARSETRRADRFLAAAVGLVVLFIVVVAFFVPHTGVAVTELVSRAIVAIPGFALAAYLAREGGRHRHVAQWAKTLEVQLKTVDAFGAPMTPADVSEVRKAFAARAFGAVPALPGRQSGDDSPAPVDPQAIIERLITALRAKG